MSHVIVSRGAIMKKKDHDAHVIVIRPHAPRPFSCLQQCVLASPLKSSVSIFRRTNT